MKDLLLGAYCHGGTFRGLVESMPQWFRAAWALCVWLKQKKVCLELFFAVICCKPCNTGCVSQAMCRCALNTIENVIQALITKKQHTRRSHILKIKGACWSISHIILSNTPTSDSKCCLLNCYDFLAQVPEDAPQRASGALLCSGARFQHQFSSQCLCLSV